MSSLQDSSESNQPKSTTVRNGLLAALLLGVTYLFYNQFGQNKKTDLQVSQIENNSEEIRTINTDLARLRDDIKENRTNIKEKEQKIEKLQLKLEAVLKAQVNRNDEDRSRNDGFVEKTNRSIIS